MPFLPGLGFRKRRKVSIFKQFVACVAIFAACSFPPAQAGNESRASDSGLAPDHLEVRSTNSSDEFGAGHVARLASFRGKIVLLSFWASWCPPCRHELASLDQLQALLGGPDFIVVPISLDGTESTIKSSYSDYGVSHLGIYQQFADDLPLLLGIDRIPTNIVINRDGSIMRISTGATQWDSPGAMDMIKSFIDRSTLLSKVASDQNAPAKATLARQNGPKGFATPTTVPILRVP